MGSAPKTFVVCGILATAIWCGGVATAADEPVPPPTTTVDAPPPDPYSPPARVAPKPRPKPASRRVARVGPVRTYTPPAPVTSQPAVQVSSAAPQRRTRAVRKQKQRTRPVRRVAKRTPVRFELAPLDDLIASVQLPLATERDAKEPYLWRAGLSFAVLAVAGAGVLLLTLRFFRPGWE